MLSYPHFPLLNKNKQKRKDSPTAELRDYEPLYKTKMKNRKIRKRSIDKDS